MEACRSASGSEGQVGTTTARIADQGGEFLGVGGSQIHQLHLSIRLADEAMAWLMRSEKPYWLR